MMNNTTTQSPNYAYLAGALQSLAESLAYDTNFTRLKNEDKRLAYVRAQIEAARSAAVKHAAKYPSI
jgi:hypothetical protein